MFTVSRSQNRCRKNPKSTPTMVATIATTYRTTANSLRISVSDITASFASAVTQLRNCKSYGSRCANPGRAFIKSL